MQWKHRSAAIFTVAGLFALKSLVRPDFASVIGFALCLGAHYVDRFFSAERIEKQLEARMKEFEDQLKHANQEIGHVKMAAGIRTGLIAGGR